MTWGTGRDGTLYIGGRFPPERNILDMTDTTQEHERLLFRVHVLDAGWNAV